MKLPALVWVKTPVGPQAQIWHDLHADIATGKLRPHLQSHPLSPELVKLPLSELTAIFPLKEKQS